MAYASFSKVGRIEDEYQVNLEYWHNAGLALAQEGRKFNCKHVPSMFKTSYCAGFKSHAA
jgi:hypothetical protein